MTVISAVITRYCTVHASDSLITKRKGGGSYEPDEWERSKIIPVHRWRGAMSYWGLATHDKYGWSTVDWLQDQVKSAGQESSAEEFAQRLANRLNEAISRMRFDDPVDSGIGIHFTVYEYVENYWIPELFLISNWVDTSYQAVSPTGVGLSRETYWAIAKEFPRPEHREAQYRVKVHEYLHQPGSMIVYNNGDPRMFNTAASAIFGMFGELQRRGKLA
jgi:hypothetical protein